MAKEKTGKVKVSNKSTKKVKVKKVKPIKDLSLWAYNDDCEIEKVIVPLKYKMDYITKFGVMEITTKYELQSWLQSLELTEV